MQLYSRSELSKVSYFIHRCKHVYDIDKYRYFGLSAYQPSTVHRFTIKIYIYLSEADIFPQVTQYCIVLKVFDVGSDFLLARQENINKNMQIYKYRFDTCIQRLANGTCAKCPTGLYRASLAAGDVCIALASFPPATGKNEQEVLVQACVGIGCLSCLNDFRLCTQCDVSGGYYLETVSSSCKHTSTFVTGTGAQASSGQVVSCLTTSCTSCVADYSICLACNTALGYYYYSSDKSCLLLSEFPPRTGIDLISGLITPCQDSNCVYCKIDSSTCVACDSTIGYYLDTTISTCTTTMHVGKGPDPLSQTIVSCLSSNCMTCSADYKTCTVCSPGYYLNPLLECVNTFSKGLGPNLAPQAVQACIDPNCITCLGSHLACTECSPGSMTVLSSASCIPATSSPAGFGLALGSQTLSACLDPNCINCSLSITVCTACDASAGFYLYNGNCLSTLTAVAARLGPSASNGELEACKVSNCAECIGSSSICTACLPGFDLKLNICTTSMISVYLPSGTPTSIPSSSQSSYLNCLSPYCVSCPTTPFICTGCEPFIPTLSTTLVLIDGNCVPVEPLMILRMPLDAKSYTLSILFEHDIYHKSLDLSLMTVRVDDEESGWHTCSISTCILSPIIEGFSIHFSFNFNILNATVEITWSDSQVKIRDESGRFVYPHTSIVRSELLLLSPSSNLIKSSKAAAVTTQVLRTSVTLLSVASANAWYLKITNLLSNFMYLQLLSGPFLIYPNLFFSLLQHIPIFPLYFDDPINGLASSGACRAPQSYDNRNITCSFVSNYYDNLLSLLLVLLICTIITTTYHRVSLANRRKPSAPPSPPSPNSPHAQQSPHAPPPQPSPLLSILTWLNRGYGLRFFTAQMMASSMEILTYVTVNVLSLPNSRGLVISCWICICAIGYYGVVGRSVTIVINRLRYVYSRPLQSNLEESKSLNPDQRGIKLETIIKEDKVCQKHFVIDVYFVDMQLSFPLSSAIPLYYTAADAIRDLVIPMVVFALTNYSILQNFLCLTLEIGFLAADSTLR